jgi:hypothetical protein
MFVYPGLTIGVSAILLEETKENLEQGVPDQQQWFFWRRRNYDGL